MDAKRTLLCIWMERIGLHTRIQPRLPRLRRARERERETTVSGGSQRRTSVRPRPVQKTTTADAVERAPSKKTLGAGVKRTRTPPICGQAAEEGREWSPKTRPGTHCMSVLLDMSLDTPKLGRTMALPCPA